MKTWALVAVAAMGLTACQNDFEEQVEAKDSVVVTFVADSADTRTSVDTSGEDKPVFAWGDNETFAVLEQTDALAEAISVGFEKVEDKANITAEFTANPGKDEYSYVTVYPASGYVSAESISAATLTLPAEQTMVDGSYDPNADLMVSEVKTTTVQPTEAQMVGFHRIAAVVEMSINNLALTEGETVEKVEFIADDKALAGTITADLNVEKGAAPTLTVVEGVSSVSVATTTSDVVYFTVLPTTLNAGDTYSVVVVTNKYLYIKQGAIPDGKSLVFESGKVTRFGVNMSGVNPSKKWVLVDDVKTLKDGDVVAIVAKNYNVVMGKQGNNFPVAAKVEAIKSGDYLYHPITTVVDDMIQPLTLMKRDNERNAFDFYNGKDYESDTSIGFVWATGNNYSPKLQAYCDINTLFDVTIADGVATITASEISGSYKYWRYYHSTYATSRKFDLTSSAITADANKILLYKLEGAVGTIPTVAANVTVPAADKPVVIAEEGAAEATADAVVFNYVGPWTISVSDNAEWLGVTYKDGKLYYTAGANTGAKREATVTITASLEGQESLTWSFNLVQKGAPEEISIAEFITKGQDVNATYKLTGKITEIPDSKSDPYVISDGKGNVANIKYLKIEGGDYVVDQDAVVLKEGDVVTVTTVVTSNTKGTGGNSTYPSYYKGHYRLTATTDKSLVGYEGDTANITVAVEQSGNISLPEDGVIQGAMAEDYDFVTFNYTNDATTATATFAENNGSSRNAVFNFTYGLTSASVSIAQENHPSVKVGWFLVTDASELNAGDKVVIAAKDSAKVLAVGSSSTSTTTLPSVDVTKTGTAITNLPATATQFTLATGLNEGEFAFTFLKGTTEYYLCAPNTNDQMKIKSGDLVYYGSWTIATDATTGEATIDTVYGTTTPTPKRMVYNSTSTKFATSKIETATTSPKAPISIYKYYN